MNPLSSSDSPILFLCGHRKAGTTLLNNLFDGHSQLSVYPVDINLLYGYFPKYNNPEITDSDLLNRIRQVVFEDLAKLPQLTGVVDLERLETNFLRNVEGKCLADMKVVLQALFTAYADLDKERSSYSYHVAKETSIELYAEEIAGWFPSCRFIHLIRDPRDNFAAIKSGLKKKYESYGDSETSLLLSVIVRNLWGIRMAAINTRLLGEHRYKALRFEDVVTNPRAVMEDVSAWLGINFQASMLEPSVCGRPTGGNSFEQRSFSGISSVNVGKWKDRITAEEAAIIEFAFAGEMNVYGYTPEACDLETAHSVSKFYKSINYKYFHYDRFGN